MVEAQAVLQVEVAVDHKLLEVLRVQVPVMAVQQQVHSYRVVEELIIVVVEVVVIMEVVVVLQQMVTVLEVVVALRGLVMQVLLLSLDQILQTVILPQELDMEDINQELQLAVQLMETVDQAKSFLPQ